MKYRENATSMAYHLTNQCTKIGGEAIKVIDELSGIKRKLEANGEIPKKIVKESEENCGRPNTPRINSFFDKIGKEDQDEADILLTRVMLEWAHWLAGTGIFAVDKRSYAWETVKTINALTWWKAWFSDTLLCKVVEMLHNVPISAGSTERNWSLRGRIHTKLRNRMKVDTANEIVFIKHNIQLEYAGLFKKVRQSEEEMESEYEEEQTIENDTLFLNVD